MVYSRSTLDRTFAALAHPTRRAILTRLSTGETAIGDLARPFSMSLPAVSKHLRVLKRAGLAAIRRDGRVRRCRLLADPLKDAAGWVERYRGFWEGQLNELARYLGESTADKESTPWQAAPTPRPRAGSRSAGSSTRRLRGSSRRGPPRKS